MSPLKISIWNTCHRQGQIAEKVAQHSPDCIILTECLPAGGKEISNQLGELGWQYQLDSSPRAADYGIFVAAKHPIAKTDNSEIGVIHLQRWLSFRLLEQELEILAVHIPGINDKNWDKIGFWDNVLAFADAQKNSPAAILGDFNTGLKLDYSGTPFRAQNKFTKLLELGWTDAWRIHNPDTREYSWYSNVGNGVRVDHAFLSPALKETLLIAYYSHRERIEKVSDHSMLILELLV